MDIGVFDTFFWVGLRHRRGSAFVKWSCRDLMGPCRICKEHKRLEYMIYDVFCEIKQVHIAEEIMHKNSVQFSIRRTDPQRRRLSPSKKVPKVPILILTPVSQNPFYVYWPKHDFLQIPGSGFNSSQVCSTQIIGRQQWSPRGALTTARVQLPFLGAADLAIFRVHTFGCSLSTYTWDIVVFVPLTEFEYCLEK